MIALYIVVLFRMQKPLERISRIVDAVKKLSSNQFPRLFQALYIALYKGHPHNIIRSTDTTVGGARAWAVLLAKTSRRAVPTAIMPIIAGGRLYKCLYKMHVDSRAFWGAFWGAFRVFLIDVG